MAMTRGEMLRKFVEMYVPAPERDEAHKTLETLVSALEVGAQAQVLRELNERANAAQEGAGS